MSGLVCNWHQNEFLYWTVISRFMFQHTGVLLLQAFTWRTSVASACLPLPEIGIF